MNKFLSLAYKKPAFLLVLVALISTVITILVFSVNPKNETLTSTPTTQGVNATEQIPIANQIEKNLETIMSSPQISSNPYDYINAHQSEYNAIIALDVKALPYLFSEFEKGGQTGLKGYIMEKLCRSILGGEDISYANKDPQDWYDAYKELAQTLVSKNSLEWMKEHNPKASLVLSS